MTLGQKPTLTGAESNFNAFPLDCNALKRAVRLIIFALYQCARPVAGNAWRILSQYQRKQAVNPERIVPRETTQRPLVPLVLLSLGAGARKRVRDAVSNNKLLMRKFQFKYLGAALFVVCIGLVIWNPPVGIGVLALPVLFGMAMPTEEFQEEVLKGVEEVDKQVKAKCKSHETAINELSLQVVELRKGALSAASSGGGGDVFKSAQLKKAAMAMGAEWVLQCQKRGKLSDFATEPVFRRRLLDECKSIMGDVEKIDNVDTDEMPLPTAYGSAFQELIAQFGVCRKGMTNYPMSRGTNKPPRMGSRPAFGFVAMAAPFPEKKPSYEFATLAQHKVGGIIVIPREIEEQSALNIGQFLMRYGAVEFARIEDNIGFLADGTGTFENIKGVCKVAKDSGRAVQLAAGNLSPHDTTLENFREMRRRVSVAAISGGSYYMSQTYESRLRSFKTVSEPDVFMYRPDGTAMLDGFPIVWTEVLAPYSTDDTASTYLAAFGKLEFWLFGQRGGPRMDKSADVYFQNDLIATRFLEELDFDYQAVDSMSALQTADA
jgi:HK97 family phage major capsid protein